MVRRPVSEPLLSRNFVAYLGSRFCAAAATTMLRAAVAWHVFALTGSAFHLGLIGLVQFVPSFALVLVGGAAADSFDRRRIMVAAQSVALLAGAVLVAAMARGALSLPVLYAVIVVVAAAGAFDSPARAALLPTLVPRAAFPRAVTIAATSQALAFATGPAVAGVLIAAAGVGSAYAVYAGLLAASLVGLAQLRPERPAGGTRAITVRAIREGLGFVRRSPVVLGCMTLDMLAVIFASATALLPIYASDILGVGPTGYGLLSSALEAGALVTSVVLVVLPPLRRAGRALLGAVAVYGLATIVFGLSRSFPLSIAAYVLVGVADQVSVVMRGTAIQLETPDELRGRVSAVSLLFIQASNQLGAAEAGFLAALTSAPFAVVGGGIAALAVVAGVGAALPALRRYRIDGEPAGAGTPGS
jgi:MFS family permease